MNRLVYREFLPPGELSHLAECFWTLSGRNLAGRSRAYRVLPDGCVDILFNTERSRAGGFSSGCSLSFVGTMTRYRDFMLAENPVYVGVRFRPGAAATFLPFPTSEITDQIVPMSDVWKGQEAEFSEQLTRVNSLEGCVEVFQRQMMREVRRLNICQAPAVDCAVKAMISTGGRAGMAELSSGINTGPRNFRRLINAHAGLSPKRLCRVLRFRRLLECLAQTPAPDWAGLACRCGYYDQAHLIHEFRELSGYTPQTYHASRLAPYSKSEERSAGRMSTQAVY